jgi:hypothetical protein
MGKSCRTQIAPSAVNMLRFSTPEFSRSIRRSRSQLVREMKRLPILPCATSKPSK